MTGGISGMRRRALRVSLRQEVAAEFSHRRLEGLRLEYLWMDRIDRIFQRVEMHTPAEYFRPRTPVDHPLLPPHRVESRPGGAGHKLESVDGAERGEAILRARPRIDVRFVVDQIVVMEQNPERIVIGLVGVIEMDILSEVSRAAYVAGRRFQLHPGALAEAELNLEPLGMGGHEFAGRLE